MEPFKMNEWQMGGSPSSATATGSEDAAPPGFRNVRKEDVTTPMKKKTHHNDRIVQTALRLQPKTSTPNFPIFHISFNTPF
jgi:hypothetical protein